jgi:phage tail-like protein
MTLVERVASPHDYPPGWLVGQLPVGMRDDDLLVRFTTIFERVGATLRAGADNVEHIADPTVAPPAMLNYLGRWLGYRDGLDDAVPLAQRRRIIAALGRALPWRGTAHGLRTILEAVTDGPVQIEEPGRVVADADELDPAGYDGTVIVRIASVGTFREHELAAFVRDEIPAHLGVRLLIGPDAPNGTVAP